MRNKDGTRNNFLRRVRIIQFKNELEIWKIGNDKNDAA